MQSGCKASTSMSRRLQHAIQAGTAAAAAVYSQGPVSAAACCSCSSMGSAAMSTTAPPAHWNVTRSQRGYGHGSTGTARRFSSTALGGSESRGNADTEAPDLPQVRAAHQQAAQPRNVWSCCAELWQRQLCIGLWKISRIMELFRITVHQRGRLSCASGRALPVMNLSTPVSGQGSNRRHAHICISMPQPSFPLH